MKESQKEPEKTETTQTTENKTEEGEASVNPKGEGRKFPTMKKSIEEVLNKVVKTKRMFKLIKKKVPNKIDIEKKLYTMRMNSIRAKKEDENCNLEIKDRTATVAERISQYEDEMKKLEDTRRMIEEERKKRQERKKAREAERKKKEEERRKKAEEEKVQKEDEEKKKEEDEEKRNKEEEAKRLEEEKKKKEEEVKRLEEERKKKEEEERIKKEIEQIKDEEEKKKREEEEKKRREEEERIRKEEEERKKKEEEERKRKEEEEKKKKEEEEKKKEEEEKKKKLEEENKAKEGVEKIKFGFLQKLNKKEEELTEEEKKGLEDTIAYEKMVADYNNSTYREATENTEGRDLKYTFEEIREISTEPLSNLEITKSGKIITLSNKELSKITIYSEKTFEEEDCIALESKVNSIVVDNDYVYCALDEPEENILVMSLKDTEDKVYLVGHTCSVTDLTLTKYGYMVSADIEGNIFVWKDLDIKKKGNDFHSYINTISETKNNTQGIAILSFKEELIKFYDLRYSTLECIETITNIKGSGLKNNMLKLNENILAVSGTYIYIIDLNALIVTNMINCVYANDCISNFHFNEKGFFFVSQALTHSWTDELEKGILAYYQYNFNDPLYPDVNTLVKLASKPNSHDHFICSIRQVDSKTIVTGGFDGKIKFWVLKELNK